MISLIQQNMLVHTQKCACTVHHSPITERWKIENENLKWSAGCKLNAKSLEHTFAMF